MMIKKILTILCIALPLVSYSSESEFTMFNYEGSRLKSIKRYNYGLKILLTQKIVYNYDLDGYLTGRELKSKGRLIYRSRLEYSDDKKQIKEYFQRGEGKRMIPPVSLEYLYDSNNNLIRYKRYDGNIYNSNITLSQDVSIAYNERNDIIYTGSNLDKSIRREQFYPVDAITWGKVTEFSYIYDGDKKTQICYELTRDRTYVLAEYYYSNSRLVKIIVRPDFNNNEKEGPFSKNYFLYDEQGRLTRTIFTDTLVDNKVSNKVIDYKYDAKNRLSKRILYYNSPEVKRLKIDESEEYIYEDGNYCYYPYLLPPKIKLYLTQEYESLVDKSVF